MNHGIAYDKSLGVLRHQGIATRELEFLVIPRRNRTGFIAQQPGFGSGEQLCCWHHFVNDAQLFTLCWVKVFAFHQVRRRALYAQHTDHALRAARAWQQTDHDFGQAKHHARIIHRDAVVASQRDL